MGDVGVEFGRTVETAKGKPDRAHGGYRPNGDAESKQKIKKEPFCKGSLGMR
jgi:hypothetical protein